MFINKSYSPPFIRQSLKCNTKFFNAFLAVQIILLLNFTWHYGHMVATTYQFNITIVLLQNNGRKKRLQDHTKQLTADGFTALNNCTAISHTLTYTILSLQWVSKQQLKLVDVFLSLWDWGKKITFSPPLKLYLSILPAEKTPCSWEDRGRKSHLNLPSL